MAVIETRGLTHRFGRTPALSDIHLAVPEGSVYALLGPNGAGKTTLLQILMGLRRPSAGTVSIYGSPRDKLTLQQRATIGYVAEGQRLPGRMTLREVEAFLAPLYATWDPSLADALRDRFRLDPSRHVRTFSRGEHMKAMLLCALAPRPRLLLMDEPFTGIDVVAKDELVGGLLESAGQEGWSVVISSHDIAELETLADWVGFIDHGRLRVSEPMDAIRERFRRVEVLAHAGHASTITLPATWLSVEHSGGRTSFLMPSRNPVEAEALRKWFPDATRIDERAASLREIYVALATAGDRISGTIEGAA